MQVTEVKYSFIPFSKRSKTGNTKSSGTLLDSTFGGRGLHGEDYH